MGVQRGRGYVDLAPGVGIATQGPPAQEVSLSRWAKTPRMQRRVGVMMGTSRLATTALLTAQRHTRAGGAGNQCLISVENIAFDQAHRAAVLDHAADGL
jgi:hypothetical protein